MDLDFRGVVEPESVGLRCQHEGGVFAAKVFAGQKLVGWPVLTVVDGVLVFERNAETGPRGAILIEGGTAGRPLIMMPWN